MNLSNYIRDLRRSRGWDLDELARRARISRGALRRIERGKTSNPRAETLSKIAQALGLAEDALREEAADASRAIPQAPPAESVPSPEYVEELTTKFRKLLGTPLAPALVQIVEGAYRLIPIDSQPPPGRRRPPAGSQR